MGVLSRFFKINSKKFIVGYWCIFYKVIIRELRNIIENIIVYVLICDINEFCYLRYYKLENKYILNKI